MRDKQPDELSLIFHVDERLAARSNTLRFAVLLEPASGGSAKSPQIVVMPRGMSARTTAGSVIWCKPDFPGPENQPVRDMGGGLGSICVVGEAKLGDVLPETIYGKIYGEYEPFEDNPPSGAPTAQFVNCPNKPNLPPPAYCGNVNFAFHPQFGNELAGARHASVNPPLNYVVIWLVRGPDVSRHSVPFFGVTSDHTACDGGGLPEAIAINSPAQYRMTLSAPFLTNEASLILRRCDKESTGRELVFKSCAQANPQSQWSLWITTKSGRPDGTLALMSVYRTKLEAPMIWRSAEWNLHGVTHLVLDSPSEHTDTAPSVTIAPV